MPCGGIVALAVMLVHDGPPERGRTRFGCWKCNKPVHATKQAPKDIPKEQLCDCFCIEWDAALHSECVPAFLESEEGQCVLEHGHQVEVWRDGKIVVLHEEKG